MALIRDFTIPGTSIVVPDAYHVVVRVIAEKRMADVPPPPGTDPETVALERAEGTEPYWKAGTHARVVVHVFESEEARLNGANPIGVLGQYPTDAGEHGAVFTSQLGPEMRFTMDVERPALAQAYETLKASAYYAEALDA